MILKASSGYFRGPSAVACEQAVYGNFAFWDRGYGLLARSPGCRDEWIAEFKTVCGRLGDRPPGASDTPSLVALRLSTGPYVIIGAFPQGVDDKGRPGATAFHALFLSPRDYRRAHANPFMFETSLRGDWTAADRSPPSLAVTPDPATEPLVPDPRGVAIARAIREGRRVVVESQEPENALMRSVWAALPIRYRLRRSCATRAFANGNRFDLLALPRLAGVEFDSSYVLETDLIDQDRPAISHARLAFWLGVVCFAIAVWIVSWRSR